MTRVRKTCDDDAVRDLFVRYYARSLALARTWMNGDVHTEDAVQEAFVRVIRERRSYDCSRPFLPWFQRILRNVCLDTLRREQRHARRLALWAREHDPVVPAPSAGRAVQDLMQSLDPADKDVLLLRFVEGLSFAHIAERLGCSEEAAKKRAQRAVRRLRHTQQEQAATRPGPAGSGLPVCNLPMAAACTLRD